MLNFLKSIQVTILIKITEEQEEFVTFRLPTSELNTFDSDFNCTTRKSTLAHTTVFLLQVMRFAKLNKPPLSIKPPLKTA